MTERTYSESDISTLIESFPVESAPVVKRTTAGNAPRPAIKAPSSGYRVTVEGLPTFDVNAAGYGDAVLMALDAATREGIANYAAHIFLWHHDVTNDQGATLKGASPAMRNALHAARIARQDNRA